jgi:hypothetical protein
MGIANIRTQDRIATLETETTRYPILSSVFPVSPIDGLRLVCACTEPLGYPYASFYPPTF